jgi:hypothetical protein
MPGGPFDGTLLRPHICSVAATKARGEAFFRVSPTFLVSVNILFAWKIR